MSVRLVELSNNVFWIELDRELGGLAELLSAFICSLRTESSLRRQIL